MRGATQHRSVFSSQRTNFNPRTPCGVRPCQTSTYLCLSEFQSTHPMRGATRSTQTQREGRTDFNPRTPCGVRPQVVGGLSAHGYFNPRTPCGVRLLVIINNHHCHNISIHAPHAGCDILKLCLFRHGYDFNPRTPCGVRRCIGQRKSF